MQFSATLLVALAVLGAARAHCPPPTHRPRLGGKTPFHVDQFSGAWHVVARAVDGSLPLPTEGVVCSKLSFAPRPDDNLTRTDITVTMKTADGAEAEFHSKAQSSPCTQSSMQIVWQIPGQDTWIGVGHLTVLATDYEQFAVDTFTKESYNPDKDLVERLTVSEVLSRTPVLDEKVLAALKSVVASLGFDASDVKDVDTSGC
ncbi:uncharacterized protein LOC134533892 [Bacillus rossius redtenbacheri]|uniref:uncharacterized protein LOC134533892 n=1 Tax=Bacillus rossius redtenbacheri TaxID=93214 RepID=UPI002FDDD615